MEVSGAPCIRISSRLMREAHLQLPAVIYLGAWSNSTNWDSCPWGLQTLLQGARRGRCRTGRERAWEGQGGHSNLTSMIFIHGPVSDMSLAKLSRPFVRAMVLQ